MSRWAQLAKTTDCASWQGQKNIRPFPKRCLLIGHRRKIIRADFKLLVLLFTLHLLGKFADIHERKVLFLEPSINSTTFSKIYLPVITFVFFLSSQALGDEFVFKLHGLPLGEATFTYPDIQKEETTQTDPSAGLNVIGRTLGWVKFFKQYSATFESKWAQKGIRNYRVDAFDSGVEEVRHIEFAPSTGVPPQIIAFKDRTQANALPVTISQDLDRIDPLHALHNILVGVNQTQRCGGTYQVYDGKRRYRVQITPIDDQQRALAESSHSATPAPTDQLQFGISCDVNLFVEEAKADPLHRDLDVKAQNKPGFWPFKKAQQSMTIHFERKDHQLKFKAFEFNSPLGKIKGNLR